MKKCSAYLSNLSKLELFSQPFPYYKAQMKVRRFFINFSISIPDKEKKKNLNFIFTLLCGASKGLMKTLKTLNFYFNKTF